MSDRCVRRATYADLPFVLEAQASMPHDLDSATPEEIAEALVTGQAEAYILIADGRYRAILAVQAHDTEALLSAFYRSGPVEGLRADAKALISVAFPLLKERGITRIHCRVSLKNPKYRKLVAFYRRLTGMKPECVMLSARLE